MRRVGNCENGVVSVFLGLNTDDLTRIKFIIEPNEMSRSFVNAIVNSSTYIYIYIYNQYLTSFFQNSMENIFSRLEKYTEFYPRTKICIPLYLRTFYYSRLTRYDHAKTREGRMRFY